MGQSPSGTSYNENGNGTPFLQGNAEFGDTFPEHKKFTTEPSKIAEKGSVLISVRAPVGDTNIADLNYCIGRGLASISLKNGDNKYLLYLLRSMKTMIEAKGTGSTFKAISKSILNDIEIPLPPLPIQHQIVAVLEHAEVMKQQREKADALTEVLLQSVFYDMFGDPVMNERGWGKKRLGNLIELKYGDGLKEDKRESSGKIPVYGSNGIIGYHNKALTDKSCLIIGRKGSIGAVHLSKGPCWPIDTTYFVEPNLDFDLKFLFYLMKTLRLNALDRSTAIPGLNRNDVYSKTIPFPPLALQQKFALVVEDVERIRVRQADSKRVIKGLFEGLMARAFAGELV
jgi:type I restriction enzyme S subunit